MNELKTLIKKNKSNLLTELFKFLSQPSISAHKQEIKKMASIVEGKLKGLGFKTQVIKLQDSNPFILAEMGSGDTTLLIYDHYDVMPVDPLNLWKSPPFEPQIREDKIFARGVADNKGHLMQRLQAIKMIMDRMGSLPIKIKFLIEGEEEMGSPHLHSLSDKYGHLWKDAHLCLWESGEVTEEDRPLLTLGMKGVAYYLLTCEIGEKDVHSGYASLVDSAVWRLVHALSTLRDADGNVTIDGLTKQIAPPTKKELQIMKNEEWNPAKLLKSLGKDQFLHHGKSKLEILKNHYFGITCNICGIWAGSTTETELKTVTPKKAQAKIDLRLVANLDSTKIKDSIRRHLDKRGFKDIKVEEMMNEQVGKSDLENKYLQKAVNIIENSYNKKVVIQPMTKGSGPIYHVASKYNIPTVQLGASYPGSSIHAPNEHVRVDDYFNGLNATVNLFLHLDK